MEIIKLSRRLFSTLDICKSKTHNPSLFVDSKDYNFTYVWLNVLDPHIHLNFWWVCIYFDQVDLTGSPDGTLVALAFKLEEGRFGQLTYLRYLFVSQMQFLNLTYVHINIYFKLLTDKTSMIWGRLNQKVRCSMFWNYIAFICAYLPTVFLLCAVKSWGFTLWYSHDNKNITFKVLYCSMVNQNFGFDFLQTVRGHNAERWFYCKFYYRSKG